jgi:DNA-binding response OmpR family regulator
VEGEIAILSDGEQAIQFITTIDAQKLRCPDLVIIDLSLPKKTGREVLEFIRGSVRCREVPVLILSSSDAPQDRDDAARLGATQYICKPSRLDEFLSLGAIFKTVLGGISGT